MEQAQHLDAERLAAFMDGSLPHSERAAVEAHAADCARCLQLLAAMARTEPPTSAAGWRLPMMFRWAVPVAAAATAMALWVNVQRGGRDVQPAAPESAVTDAVSPAPPPAASPGAPPAAKSEPDPADRSARRFKPSVPAEAANEAAKPAARPPVGALGGGRDQASSRDERRKDALEQKAVQPEASEEKRTGAETLRSRAADKDASVREGQMLTLVDVLSPDPMVRWRARDTLIERSTDGGKTWGSPVAIPHASFLAGSSPSPQVAWLAGRGGAVWRTTNGQEWRRIEFPEAVDLTTVRAVSDREAEVTAADGRVFRTADGGVTWSRPHLQEISGPSF